MVAPFAVDAEIGPGQPLAFEAVALKEARRSDVCRDAGGLQPMQPQIRERKAHRRRDRTRHIAAARIGRAHPVAEGRGLGDAAADASDRDAADQRMIALAEDHERVGLVARHFLGLAAKSAAEGAAGEVVRRPGRLPGDKKIAALFAHVAPSEVVAVLGRPQVQAIAPDGRGRVARSADAEKRHRLRSPKAAASRGTRRALFRSRQSPRSSAPSAASRRQRRGRPRR
jgi:hypothetical protein